MSAEEETIREDQSSTLDVGTTASPAGDAGTAHGHAVAANPPSDGPRLRVFVPGAGKYPEETIQVFQVRANRWDRMQIPLPRHWREEGLWFEIGAQFALLEIVGMRLLSNFKGETTRELLTSNLSAKFRVLGGVRIDPDAGRLRVLCVGDKTHLGLSDVDLPQSEGALILEVGLRLRTEPVLIGHALRQWADGTSAKLHDALVQAAAARADGDHRTAALRAQLAVAGTACAHAETHAAFLLSEIENARADGDQREIALRQQLASAHEAARAHAATLTVEIAAARAYGDERAAVLTSALEGARLHGDQRAAASGEQLERSQNEFLAARAQWQEERASLFARLDATDRMLSQARQELAAARRTAGEERGRVRSMQRSGSWRITMPLRIVQRALTGRRTTDSKLDASEAGELPVNVREADDRP